MGRVLRWSALLVGGGATAAALVRLRRVATIAAAYKAKILASAIFGSGRTIDVRRADEVSADSYWPMRLLRARVDYEERSVTVSLLGFLAADGHLSPRPGGDAGRARRPRRASGRSQYGDTRSFGRPLGGRAPRRKRATSAGASVAGRRRIAGARPGRGLGVLGARPQAPAAQPRHRRRPRRADRRRAVRTRVRCRHSLRRLVDDQERAQCAGRHSCRRRPALAPRSESAAPLAVTGSARDHPTGGSAADAQRLEILGGLFRSGIGCHRDAVQSRRCRGVCRRPASDRRARHHVELFERDDEHPVSARAPHCWRSRLPRLAAAGAVRSDRHGDGGDGARPVGDFRRLFLHARHRAGLGAIRPAVSAGGARGKDARSCPRRGSASARPRRRSRRNRSTVPIGGSGSSRSWAARHPPLGGFREMPSLPSAMRGRR